MASDGRSGWRARTGATASAGSIASGYVRLLALGKLLYRMSEPMRRVGAPAWTTLQNTWGRLTAANCQLGPQQPACVYQYSYNQAGRVPQQKMSWQFPDGSDGSTGPQTYQWDKEGRMTSLTYPGLNGATGPQTTTGLTAWAA